mmetsp:Transcript_12360/g.29969  ORF Transcript_12360/g.29969 Transcript_12360/m.29969 type:complete len:540 (+) Transcript_12360:309-1928(+)|eukprot:CAMPEP_0178999700 /NCGR_PEP_ID=MMETSP0795-20121207/10224_1 /TAXON_ID=88552 /ORGANISM="Amoebophrya sp., Strain Ameob2" /LENGTH=539 /DNA_ID=CAMNT_0020692539 /DNA_START=232 /DNA_END=1851 /DNA_ORIENTATION=-
MTSANEPKPKPEDLKEERVCYWRRNKDGLFGIYRFFPEVARIGTDYMWMPAYCKSNFKVGTIADETIRPHDFKCMVTNQIGPNAAEVSDYIPYVICEFLLYIFAMVFWKSAAFRDSHHVFVDMFLLRKRYPALFRMMADKEQQQNFYQQRQREIPAGSVNGSRMPGRNLQWTKRFSPLEMSSLPFEIVSPLRSRSTVSTVPPETDSSPSEVDSNGSSRDGDVSPPSNNGEAPQLPPANSKPLVLAEIRSPSLNAENKTEAVAASTSTSLPASTTASPPRQQAVTTGVAGASSSSSASSASATSPRPTRAKNTRPNYTEGGSSSSSAACYPVFVKPRLGAYGEDCHIRDLRQVVKLVNQPNCEWTEKRVRFLLFEQLLQNSDEFQKAMKAAGITSSLAHPLVTIRIWTKRFVEEDWVAALLVGPEDEEISNSKANQCFVVDKNEFTIRGGKGGNKGGTGGGNGKTIAVPYFAEMLETALWAHDQTPQLPMLGSDFAICNEGFYLLEVNPMCSYTRYAYALGHLYSEEEVDLFIRRQNLCY